MIEKLGFAQRSVGSRGIAVVLCNGLLSQTRSRLPRAPEHQSTRAPEDGFVPPAPPDPVRWAPPQDMYLGEPGTQPVVDDKQER